MIPNLEFYVDRVLDIVEVDYRDQPLAKRQEVLMVLRDVIAATIKEVVAVAEAAPAPVGGPKLGTFTRAGGIRP